MIPLLLLSALQSVAQAEELGTILQLDGPHLYVSLGGEDGLAAGATVYLYRSVQATDPKGRRTLQEDFLVGEGRVVEAGLTMSRVETNLSTLAQLRVGDRVARSPLQRPPPAPIPLPVTAAPATSLRPAAADLFEVLQANLAAPTEARRAALLSWIGRWPDDPLRPAVQAELQAMARARLEPSPAASGAPETATEPESPDPGAPPVPQVSGDVLSVWGPAPIEYRADLVVPFQARPGAPVPVVLSLSHPEELRDITAMWRRQGDPSWTPAPMTPYGDSARWAELPAQEEGAIEVFVTATQADGLRVEAGSSPQLPRLVPVRSLDEPAAQPGRRLRLRYDRDAFNGEPSRDHIDHSLVAYRTPLGERGKHSLEVMGGRRAGADPRGRPVTLQYGRTALSVFDEAPVGLQLSSMVGTDRAGINTGRGLGLRLGRLSRAAFTPSVIDWGRAGAEYRLDLDWGTVPTVPMRAGVVVTDLPNNGAPLGLLLDLEAHHPFTDHVGLGLRVGYGLRSIESAGLAAGLSTELSW